MTATSAGERLDHLPLTRLHCLAIALCAFGFTFDLFEIALGSVLSAVFSLPPYAAKPEELAYLLSSVYVGAIAGAPIVGWLGDRLGRRVMLMAALLGMGAASLACATSTDTAELTLWRCVAGLALGGFPPLMIAYLTDLLPAGRRGALIFVTVAIGTLGPAVGIFIVRALVPLAPFGLEAWRWGFIIGGVGAIAVGALCFLLPESPRWLQARNRTEQAERQYDRLRRSATVLPAIAPRPLPQENSASGHARPWRHWPVIAGLFFLTPWSTVAFPLLTGAILSQKGFRLTDTLLYAGLAGVGPLAGTLLSSLGVDRIGRRSALAGCAVMMIVCGACFVSSRAPLWLIVGSVGFSLFGMLFVSTLNVYASEVFPTTTRATAIAAAWACNRVGAACSPLLLLPLMGSMGAQAMFAVIGASLLATMVALRFAPPGRPGGMVG